MNKKSLFDELIEDRELDSKIVKSFKSKNTLSDKIFNKTKSSYIMNDDVRNKLLKISDTFMDFLGIEFFVHDVVLTGSLANYNWSEYSDVDLHILVDFEDSKYNKDLLKEFFDSKKNNWNNTHNIKIKGYEAEIYVQDISEPHVSSGVYSVLNNEWVVTPEKVKPNIDDRKIIEKGEEFASKIDSLDSGNTKLIDKVKERLKKFRQCGLSDGGEYSYENLTFKLLRRNGYIEKLMNKKTKVVDKELSITQ